MVAIATGEQPRTPFPPVSSAALVPAPGPAPCRYLLRYTLAPGADAAGALEAEGLTPVTAHDAAPLAGAPAATGGLSRGLLTAAEAAALSARLARRLGLPGASIAAMPVFSDM